MYTGLANQSTPTRTAPVGSSGRAWRDGWRAAAKAASVKLPHGQRASQFGESERCSACPQHVSENSFTWRDPTTMQLIGAVWCWAGRM